MIKIFLFAPLVPAGLVLVAVLVCILIMGLIFLGLVWLAFEAYYLVFPRQRPRLLSINDFVDKYRSVASKDDNRLITV